MPRHQWSVEDDLAALYVFRFGTDKLRLDRRELAERLGIDPGSFRMRVENFKAIAGEGGLGNFAEQSLHVYEDCGGLSEAELRRLAFAHVNLPPQRS